MRLHQRAEESSRTIAPAITSPLSAVGAASGLRATLQRSPLQGPEAPVSAAATWGSAALGPVSAVDRMTAHLQMRAKDPMAAIGMGAGGRVSPLPGEKTPDKNDPNTSAEHDDVRHESPSTGPPSVDAGEVRSRLGAGSSLPVPVVQKFESAYGHDLSSVRVHSSNSMADQLGARAFTVGRDVAFAPGEYRPGTTEGDRLIGHELAHVVQQSGGEGTVQGAGLSEDAYEREADHAADRALSGHRVPQLSAVGARVQRDPKKDAAAPAAAPADKDAGAAPSTDEPQGSAAPQMSKEDARRILYARTTLSKVKPLDSAATSTLENALKHSTAYAIIKERDDAAKRLAAKTEELDEARYNQQDQAGPPSDESVAQTTSLSTEVKALTDDVNRLQTLVRGILLGLNVSEEEIVRYVSVDFPEMFVLRAKQIAIAQLDENEEMAELEWLHYKDVCTSRSDGGPEARNGLRAAAGELSSQQQAIQELEMHLSEAHKDLPPGGVPDGEHSSSSRYDLAREEETQARIIKMRADLSTRRAELGLKYPILYREEIDVARLAKASDEDLGTMVGETIGEILANIEATKANIQEDKLKIWRLDNIVNMAVQDLGVERNRTLLDVIEARRQAEAQQEADSEAVATGIKALALTAAVIASLATMNPGPLVAVSFVLSAVEVVDRTGTNAVRGAARDVSLDPAVAQMISETPEYGWLILAVANVVLSGSQLVKIVSELRAAMVAFDTFAAVANRSLPPDAARRIIQAARQFRFTGVNLASQIRGIGAAFAEVDRAKIGLALARYAKDAFTSAFLDLSNANRILPMTEEAIMAASGPERGAELVAKYITRAGANVKYGGCFDPVTRTIFIAGDSTVGGVAGTVIHELTHHFQRAFELSMLTNYTFYAELQAHLAQQGFLLRAAADYGEEVVPEASRWMLTANDAEIAARITKAYLVRPDPAIGLSRAALDDILEQMMDNQMRMIDRKAKLFEALREKVQ